ncbi:MAG: hypothetical protein KDA24_21830 [Deltaproteobacteria bacterium]|nr:hypothetical protein [Deltaproteobacteria bacterium]
MRSPLVQRALLILAGLVVGGLGSELALRGLGLGPTTDPAPPFVVEPASWVQPDEVLGFVPAPGEFTLRFPDGTAVPVAHDPSGRRATPRVGGAVLEVHGGSFAYGLGLEDSQTLPWLIADATTWRVRNHAAPGHGPLQALLSLERAVVSDEAPDAMVLAYASFQDERVTVVRNWRRSLALGGTGLSELPCARGRRGSPRVGTCDAGLSPLPLADRLAVVHRLDLAGDVVHNLLVDSHKVTRNLIAHLHGRAEDAGVRFLLVGLDDDNYTAETLRWCSERGVPVLDAGLGWRDPRWRLPFDATHPNADAQAAWARQIAEALPAR